MWHVVLNPPALNTASSADTSSGTLYIRVVDPGAKAGFYFAQQFQFGRVFVDDDAGDDGAADAAILASYDEADEEARLA